MRSGEREEGKKFFSFFLSVSGDADAAALFSLLKPQATSRREPLHSTLLSDSRMEQRTASHISSVAQESERRE